MTDTYAAEGEDQKSYASAQPWIEKIQAYRSAIEDKWEKQRENLDKLYSKDERSDAADREYSIFWANIEVLKPATYARTPVPVVAPRFKQANQVASSASEMLERCLITTFERSDIDGCMREVRDEFLRYGRGTSWVRLGVDRNEVPQIEYDFVGAADFAHDPQPTWRRVVWVAKREWLTKEKGVARFGDIFESVPLKKRDKDSAVEKKDDYAPVWECWDKDKNKVYWICEDCEYILDEQDPWLDLTQFWPCPKPAYGTVVPGKLKPVPDIRQYKDQIEEINEYTARIAAISEKLRLQGFYPAGAPEIGDAIEAALKITDNRAILVPIASFAALGNIAPKDLIIWLPFAEAAELVKSLVELRRILIEDVYQITGISDILRGDTEASETLGAQQLKSQWGTIRIRDRSNELQRVALELARISGEIMAENFPPEVLKEMSQVQLPSQQEKAMAQAQMQQAQQAAQMAQGMQAPPIPPEQMQQMQKIMEQPSFEEVTAFLANDRARGFVIEIETDSTIQPDEDAEKNRRVEFVTAVGGLFQQAAPIVMQAPQLGPFMGEVLKFAAQGFRAGRPLEGAIDQMVESLKQMATQAQQAPQTDPEAEARAKEAEAKLVGTKAQSEAKVMGAKADMAKTGMDMQASAQSHQQAMERMAAEAAMPPKTVN